MQTNTIEAGAALFRYEQRGRTLKPQQYEVGACLDKRAGASAILMSRRSAKTESVILWTVGMMSLMPNLKVAFTMATTREAARAKFLADVYPIMEELAEADPDVHLLKGAGYERLTLPNGSHFAVLAPNDKAFRSKEFDIVIVDESGHADPSVPDELLPALLPTLDTSELGMLIVMGTAGEYRDGNLLWDTLHDPDAEVVDYSAEDGAIDIERLADWDYARQMLEAYHPGVGTLTTVDRLKRNWTLLKPERFAREYLSVWGRAGGDGGLFDAALLADAALEGDLPAPPQRFALAMHCDSQGRWALVAAWREDDEGRVLLLDFGERMPLGCQRARDIARKYRVPIALDVRANQTMMDAKQRLEQQRPAPRLELQTFEDVGAAFERFTDDMIGGRIGHWNQGRMVDALSGVKRVQMGNRWKFAPIADEARIPEATAAAIALRSFDAKPRSRQGVLAPVAV
jgi:hypothetical protein